MNQPYTGRIHDSDVALVEDRFQAPPETRSVAGFAPDPGLKGWRFPSTSASCAPHLPNVCGGPISWAGCRMTALPRCR
jgi:hypothetical protein